MEKDGLSLVLKVSWEGGETDGRSNAGALRETDRLTDRQADWQAETDRLTD